MDSALKSSARASLLPRLGGVPGLGSRACPKGISRTREGPVRQEGPLLAGSRPRERPPGGRRDPSPHCPEPRRPRVLCAPADGRPGAAGRLGAAGRRPPPPHARLRRRLATTPTGQSSAPPAHAPLRARSACGPVRSVFRVMCMVRKKRDSHPPGDRLAGKNHQYVRFGDSQTVLALGTSVPPFSPFIVFSVGRLMCARSRALVPDAAEVNRRERRADMA